MGINIYDPSKALGDKITELDRKSLCELCSALCVQLKARAGFDGYCGGYTRPISASETTATSPSARDAARISARKK